MRKIKPKRNKLHVTKRKNDFMFDKRKLKEFVLRHKLKASLTFSAVRVPVFGIIGCKLLEFQLTCNGAKCSK